MNLRPLSLIRLSAMVLITTLAAGPALAEKPEWAGQGKDKKDKKEKHGYKGHESQADVRVGGYFVDQQRVVIRDYYGQQYRVGKCPPGLAKKNNDCMPPGQAKKWAVGQPLPRDVVYYAVPQAVVLQLGTPPAGHKYVRVASDILLIAIGSSMIVDAIQDLGRL